MSVPTAPQITIRPLATNQALQFYWTTPISDGGAAITGYTLSCTGLSPQSVTASTYTYQYTGLTNGTSYTFSITAENTNGSSPAAVFRTVQPGNKPGAVQTLTSSRTANPAMTLNWAAPASDGGASILGYTVKATSDNIEEAINKQSVDVGSTQVTVSGLTAGNVYRYAVNAVNDPGYSTEVNTGLYSLTSSIYQSQITSEWNYWCGITCDISGTKILATTGAQFGIPEPLYRSIDAGGSWKSLTGTPYNFFNKCASSADGTKLVAAVSTGYIFTSADSGLTWVQRTASGSRAWRSICCSADGSVIFANVSTAASNVYLSTDSGATWTAPAAPGSRTWVAVCCSSNGQVLAACSSSVNIWMSIDGGANWLERTNSTALFYNIIACSADGTKLIAATTNGLIRQSTDTGANWSTVLTIASNPSQIQCTAAASSADGSKLFVATFFAIYTSIDSGVTWKRTLTEVRRFTNFSFLHITCSADGKNVYAVKQFGQIWRSRDSGATWGKLITPRNNAAYASCMSADGTVQYTAELNSLNGYIWKSTDKGVTWNITGQASIGGAKVWRWLACSADGTRVFATETTGNQSVPWKSTDSGATWEMMTGIPNFGTGWRGICCDISGTKLAAAYINAFIYTSDDSGVTWTSNSNSSGFRIWRGLACSADRTKMVACVNTASSYIYTSIDSGVTWVQQTGSGANNWFNVVCTPDFTQMLASLQGGGVYRSIDSGVTWSLVSGLPSTASYIFSGLAMSSDGTKLAAGDLTFGLYTSTDSGTTWVQEAKAVNSTIYTASMNTSGSILLAPSYYGAGPYTKQLFG